MVNSHLFFYRLAFYLTIATTLLSGIIILIKGGRSKRNRAFALFSFFVAGWSILQVQVSFIQNQEAAFLLTKIYHMVVIFCPYTFLRFTYLFLEVKKKNLTLAIFFFLTLLFAFLAPFRIFSPGPKHLASIGWTMIPGLGYHLYTVFFIFMTTVSLYKLYRKMSHSKGIKAEQMQYIFWPALIGFSAGCSNFFYTYNQLPIINPFAVFGLPVYVFIITYGMLKHRFLDINLMIKKTFIYGIMYSLSLAIFSAIVILTGQWMISGAIDQRVIILSMLAVVIIVSIVKPLDNILTGLTDKFLFRKKYEYHRILKEASSGMIRIRQLDKLLKLIVGVIFKHVRITNAAVFLLDKQANAYIVKASRGKPKISGEYLKMTHYNPLVKYLQHAKKTVVCDEPKIPIKHNSGSMLAKAIEEMRKLNASLIIPCFIKDRLIGFLLLGEKLSGEVYSQEDLNLFNTLSMQAGLAIENAEAYEELSRTKDKLFEAEKFASIGRLAGGIAHEIKNPLVAIKTFTEYLNKKFDDAEFRNKFQNIVGSEVDRINHIVEQLVTYSHPKHLVLKNINAALVINETLALIEDEAKKKSIRIRHCYSSSPNATCQVDPEQLKQVLLNIFLNGIQAMENNNGKTKELNISTTRENDSLIITVSDTGKGISSEYLPLIFDPFFTTRETGFGLGLAIVKSIVENHKGKIFVTSELDKGTNFTLSFPCSEKKVPKAS